MIRALLYEKGNGVSQISRTNIALPKGDQLLWVDIENPSDEEALILAEVFGFHDLAVEDCLTIMHQPKIDFYDGYLFIVSRAIQLKKPELVPETIGLSTFMGTNYLVTFHRHKLPSVSQTFEKCKSNAGIIARGIDFLYHTILDTQVDRYFPILDDIEDEVEKLESIVLGQEATSKTFSEIFHLKTELSRLEKNITGQMNVLNNLRRRIAGIVSKRAAAYYSDIYDNMARIRSLMTLYRDNLITIFDVSVNLTSQKTNEIMRVLTIIATIMMPLTVITGFYGMNFLNIPLMKWKFGYGVVTAGMLLVTFGMLVFFRRKKWI